jgi:hypothetical protein
LTTTESNLHADARAADAATDYVFAAFEFLIDASPSRTLVFDRAALRPDWTRKLLIELTDDSVRFSFPSSIQ